jgi:hypothetical protein
MEFMYSYAYDFPIKRFNFINHEQIENLVDRILSAKQADPAADTSALEAEIDLMVYRLYGLSYEEVKIVDPEFWMGEECLN